ncbi:MAG: hypothetical protein JWO95_921 [Verrucomicrobiales bacterium]|nr:hypothetical protein [Verrucomicrobiales bacterium]
MMRYEPLGSVRWRYAVTVLKLESEIRKRPMGLFCRISGKIKNVAHSFSFFLIPSLLRNMEKHPRRFGETLEKLFIGKVAPMFLHLAACRFVKELKACDEWWFGTPNLHIQQRRYRIVK